jgi:hypothetical protein
MVFLQNLNIEITQEFLFTVVKDIMLGNCYQLISDIKLTQIYFIFTQP